MIVELRSDTSAAVVQELLTQLDARGVSAHAIPLVGAAPVLRIGGSFANADAEWLHSRREVAQVRNIDEPYMLASRSFQKRCSILDIGGVQVGGDSDFVIMAGPCSIESEQQIRRIARSVKRSGADILRGGAFKPRSSPYDFQGLGVEGLKLLRAAADENQMPCVTEILDLDHLEDCARYADVLQVGTRNAHNYALLRELGRLGKPVLLTRGMASQIQEWLLAGEYLLANGNRKVLLCERGIRSFETSTRSTLDVSAVPVAQMRSHLPVIVDPSHAAGARALVPSLAYAAAAAGAHGIIVEVHDHPECAWSDGPQALLPETFARLVTTVREISRLTAESRRDISNAGTRAAEASDNPEPASASDRLGRSFVSRFGTAASKNPRHTLEQVKS